MCIYTPWLFIYVGSLTFLLTGSLSSLPGLIPFKPQNAQGSSMLESLHITVFPGQFVIRLASFKLVQHFQIGP